MANDRLVLWRRKDRQGFFTYVYSLRESTRLDNSGTPAGLYTQRGDVDYW